MKKDENDNLPFNSEKVMPYIIALDKALEEHIGERYQGAFLNISIKNEDDSDGAIAIPIMDPLEAVTFLMRATVNYTKAVRKMGNDMLSANKRMDAIDDFLASMDIDTNKDDDEN